jgi:hypothetical protein
MPWKRLILGAFVPQSQISRRGTCFAYLSIYVLTGSLVVLTLSPQAFSEV